jgi:hypothetical protein
MRVLFLLLLFVSSFASAQQLPLWRPGLGYTPDLSPQAYKAFEQWGKLSFRSNLTEDEKKELEAINLRYTFVESMESLEHIEGVACSWYCGGGPYAITASSALKPQGRNSYEAAKAHDLSFTGAWVEGVAGNGFGEWLEYRFAAGSPRITEIKIYNGYVKNEKAWQENARVRTLKLYVNDKPTALLKLEDSRAEQSFKLPEPWGRSPQQPEMVLRFEIIDVYRGSKHEDTALTEIFFDGLDVHCFVKGSLVSMADGSFRPIEQLREGDVVLSYNQSTEETEPAEILGTAMATHCKLLRLNFDNGTSVTTTPDHPFLLSHGKWASFDPAKSRMYTGYEGVFRKIEGGDIFNHIGYPNEHGLVRLVRIEELHAPQPTYTITRLKGQNQSFIVNGLVVGTEELEVDIHYTHTQQPAE